MMLSWNCRKMNFRGVDTTQMFFLELENCIHFVNFTGIRLQRITVKIVHAIAAIACFFDLRPINCKLLLQADFVRCLPIFVAIFCYKSHKKTCFSITYTIDLKCCCITVQFYIALQLEVQEVDVISTILIQMKKHTIPFL